MASPYAPQRGGGGSAYARPRGGAESITVTGGPAKPKPRRGVGGFLTNLLEDVEETLTGIPSGLYHTAVDPIKTAKAIGRSYRATYGPLFRGDIGKFGRTLYDDPLGPLLDLATVATLGAGAAVSVPAKLGATAGVAGKLARAGQRGELRVRSAGALAEEGRLSLGVPAIAQGEQAFSIVTRRTSRNPLIRGRQKLVHRGLLALPATTPGLGELARFTRAAERASRHRPHQLRVRAIRFRETYTRLGRWDSLAAYHLLTAVDPEDTAKAIESFAAEKGIELGPIELGEIARRRDPRLRAALENPKPKVLRAVAEGRQLSKFLTEQRIAAVREKATEAVEELDETAPDFDARAEAIWQRAEDTIKAYEERPYLHHRLNAGARFLEPINAPSVVRTEQAVRRIEREVARAETKVGQQKFTAEQRKKLTGGGEEPVASVRRQLQDRADELDARWRQMVQPVFDRIDPYKVDIKAARREQRDINKNNELFRRQQEGVTRAGKVSGRAGRRIPRKLPSVKQRAWQEAEDLVVAMLRQRPDDPMSRQLLEELEELDAIRAALGGEAFEPFLGSVDVPAALARAAELGVTPETITLAPALGRYYIGRQGEMLRPQGSARLDLLLANLARARELHQSALAREASRHGLSEAEVLARAKMRAPMIVGGPPLEELREALAANEPVYMPDLAVAEPRRTVAKMGGGRSPQVREQALRQDRGILHLSGMLQATPEVLDKGFTNYIRAETFRAVHRALVEQAVKIPRTGPAAGLPAGWAYIRQLPSESISYTQKIAGETRDELARYLEGAEEINMQPGATRVDVIGERLVAREADGLEGELEGGPDYFLAVPDQQVRQLAGEFTRTQGMLRALWDKPTAVWRAIVLNLRPAFFVNNVVGNYFLLALRTAGPRGAVAYLSFLREVQGSGWLSRWWARNRTTLPQQRAFRQLLEERLPELIQGTAGRTQFPDLTRVPGGRRLEAALPAMTRFREGVGPITAKVAEDVPREIMARAVLAPHVQRLAGRIVTQSDEFTRLSRRALDENPQLANDVIREVNETLGDYLNMTEFERRTVRSIIPFYAWLRAISMITGRLAADRPGVSNLLANLGRVGEEATREELGELPTFLAGVIPVGEKEGGRIPVINTAPLNPFGTPPQILRAASGILAGTTGEIGPAVSEAGLNPLAQALIEQISGHDLFTGAPVQGGRVPGLPGRVLEDVVRTLPPFRLAQTAAGMAYQGKPGSPTLYEKDLRTELLAYLGLPYKQLSTRRAREYAAKERERGR